MAARNRTKLFNLLQAGNVPADGTDWFRVSKMRRRFGAVFMSGVDGLNVPAPALFESSPNEVLRNGNPATSSKSAFGPRNLQQTNMRK